MKHNIYIVGMGPGAEEQMTGQAIAALEESDRGLSGVLKAAWRAF